MEHDHPALAVSSCEATPIADSARKTSPGHRALAFRYARDDDGADRRVLQAFTILLGAHPQHDRHATGSFGVWPLAK
jgi:hypothetical protein